MEPSDFIFNQVYKGAMAKGVVERIAHNAAVIALDDFKKGRFSGKASKLIADRIAAAKRVQK